MTDNRARAILRIDGFTRRLPPFTSEGPKALPTEVQLVEIVASSQSIFNNVRTY